VQRAFEAVHGAVAQGTAAHHSLYKNFKDDRLSCPGSTGVGSAHRALCSLGCPYASLKESFVLVIGGFQQSSIWSTAVSTQLYLSLSIVLFSVLPSKRMPLPCCAAPKRLGTASHMGKCSPLPHEYICRNKWNAKTKVTFSLKLSKNVALE